jgi:uncharacterized SAM-binding protein YcdF (DUF218 family)
MTKSYRAGGISVVRALVAALALTGALFLLTIATPLTTILAHRLAGPIEQPTAPLLIVLSSAGPVDGMVSESSYWRCVYAVRAWRSGGFQRILLSGDRSDAMKRFLVSERVPESSIDLEDKATSTRQNALFTAAMLRGRSAPPPVLLTSDYHMFRARKSFEKAGLAIVPRPIPDAIKRSVNWFNRPAVLVEELTELAKIAGYRWRGWI